jgi:hypothetical protein
MFLLVHFREVIGSPAVFSFIISFKSLRISGSFSSMEKKKEKGLWDQQWVSLALFFFCEES